PAALDRPRYFRARPDPARNHGKPFEDPGFCRSLFRLLLGNGRELEEGDRQLFTRIRLPAPGRVGPHAGHGRKTPEKAVGRVMERVTTAPDAARTILDPA